MSRCSSPTSSACRPAARSASTPRLQRRQPLLLQPLDLGRRERQRRQLVQRRPRQSDSARARSRRPAPRRRPPAPRGPRPRALEGLRVELARAHAQAYASRCWSAPRGQRLAQPRDVDLHRLTAPRGSSPHSASASRSALTGSFACSSSTARTAAAWRRRAPPRAPPLHVQRTEDPDLMSCRLLPVCKPAARAWADRAFHRRRHRPRSPRRHRNDPPGLSRSSPPHSRSRRRRPAASPAPETWAHLYAVAPQRARHRRGARDSRPRRAPARTSARPTRRTQPPPSPQPVRSRP